MGDGLKCTTLKDGMTCYTENNEPLGPSPSIKFFYPPGTAPGLSYGFMQHHPSVPGKCFVVVFTDSRCTSIDIEVFIDGYGHPGCAQGASSVAVARSTLGYAGLLGQATRTDVGTPVMEVQFNPGRKSRSSIVNEY